MDALILADAMLFLSTLSLRRATSRAETIATEIGDFYPRSPCGERHGIIGIINNVINDFYPRSPCGERQKTHCQQD